MADQNSEDEKPRKGPLAFRTISEVADELHVPQHVLRFWEGRFENLRPVKKGGGRRYYRPEDVELLRRISDLLYTRGYTVKGAQQILNGEQAETDQSSAAEEKSETADKIKVKFSAIAEQLEAVQADLRRLRMSLTDIK